MRGSPVGRARTALRRHVAVTGVTVLVVLLATLAAEWFVARGEAERVAESVTARVASTVVHTLSAADLSEGVADRAGLAANLEAYFATGMIVRVKVWRVEGDSVRVLYSDERRAEGDVREFSPALAARLDAGEVVVLEVPDDQEHRFESSSGLREGFVGFEDAAGAPMRLEVYVPVPVDEILANALGVQLPLITASLVVFGAAIIPLSIVLVRRIRDVERERRRAAEFGIEVRRQERADLARRLHDGVIQDLAGARLALESISRPDDAHTARVVDRVTDLLANGSRLLRGLLDGAVDAPAGVVPLRDELAALVERATTGSGEGAAPTVLLDVRADVTDPDGARLLARCAQELLRNAVRHARASVVLVALTRKGSTVRLVVADDGVGIGDGAPEAGHAGLALVRLAVTEAGGSISLGPGPGPGPGTRIEIELPVAARE